MNTGTADERAGAVGSSGVVPVDSILLLSFGGPEGPDQVVPFLRNVTRGRGIPDERLVEVGRHYELFDGISPINDQNRALLSALRDALDAAGVHLPLYWGNRNWHPMLNDTVQRMVTDERRHALVLATSAYSSYSSCRQYRENLEAARVEVDGAPLLTKVRPFFNHPGFVEASVDRLRTALRGVDPESEVHLLFTAHSIPASMADGCDYQAQLAEVARLCVDGLDGLHSEPSGSHRVVFQSRSGPPQVPWLEPDVCDAIEELVAASGRPVGEVTVVVVPIGFVSDHMEVVYDLDTEAAAVCERLGVTLVRVPTVGTHDRFVAGLVELVVEQLAGGRPVSVGALAPRPTPCAEGCCPAGTRPQRPGVRP